MSEREWIKCRCGKVVQRQQGIEADFAKLSMCASCSMDVQKALDMCPESIWGESSVTACGLPWTHTGRCEPIIDSSELAQAILTRGVFTLDRSQERRSLILNGDGESQTALADSAPSATEDGIGPKT